MEIEVNTKAKVDIKTLRTCIKVSDSFNCDIIDANGNKVENYSYYVPDFFPGNHYGDYLMLDIDIETGKITNWKKPTPEELQEMLYPEDD
ncbi:hypothetical protein ABN057_20285 [Providencia alcalifaciens]|uniref:hypothetical protein n=1 Tax=Providencia alcalifaciens TaxID=126385 RepID=UPI0032D9D44A